MKARPTIAQAMFGQPTEEFEIPDWVESMLDGIYREWKRVWWNRHQKPFEDQAYDEPHDFGAVHWRPYSWGDDDAGPNFWIDDDPLRIRWYKHFGRGMSASHEYTPEQWIAWHDKTMAAIRANDVGGW